MTFCSAVMNWMNPRELYLKMKNKYTAHDNSIVITNILIELQYQPSTQRMFWNTYSNVVKTDQISNQILHIHRKPKAVKIP